MHVVSDAEGVLRLCWLHVQSVGDSSTITCWMVTAASAPPSSPRETECTSARATSAPGESPYDHNTLSHDRHLMALKPSSTICLCIAP